MNIGTKLSIAALAALLACAPMGAFARTGSQSNSGSATPNRAATQWGLTGASESDQQREAAVARIQQQLQKEGYYKKYGPVDGVMDPSTHVAIRNFQQSKWIAPTGELDSQTMTALQADQPTG